MMLNRPFIRAAVLVVAALFSFASPAAAIVKVSSIDTPGNANAVTVHDGIADVADGTGGLRLVDVSNPAAPTGIDAVPTPDNARGIAVEAGYAYVAIE